MPASVKDKVIMISIISRTLPQNLPNCRYLLLKDFPTSRTLQHMHSGGRHHHGLCSRSSWIFINSTHAINIIGSLISSSSNTSLRFIWIRILNPAMANWPHPPSMGFDAGIHTNSVNDKVLSNSFIMNIKVIQNLPGTRRRKKRILTARTRWFVGMSIRFSSFENIFYFFPNTSAVRLYAKANWQNWK